MIVAKKTFYDVLGVTDGAGQLEVKTAYRALARRFHPDVSDEDNAEEKFKEVQRAYDILSDRDKRSDYDAELRMLASADLPASRLDIVMGSYDSLDPKPKRKQERQVRRKKSRVYEEDIPEGYGGGDETAGGIFPKNEDIV